MTAPVAGTEAERATSAYQAAVTAIGVETVKDALEIWDHVPPGSKAAVVASWLKQVMKQIMRRRDQARDLSMAYYRLSRALQTGKTVADPEDAQSPPTVTLEELRTEFATLAGSALENGTGGHSVDDGAKVIPVEEIEHLATLEKLNSDAAERELMTVLQALGPAAQERKLTQQRESDEELKAAEHEKRQSEAHSSAGKRQAAAAGRVAMNGARTTSWLLQQNDKAALGWARISTTGTPCGWCAMLISRGAVYKSEDAATYDDGDLYHDNCHCIAIPVFTDEFYGDAPIFDLNRKYEAEWPKAKAAAARQHEDVLTVWRRYFRTGSFAAPQ